MMALTGIAFSFVFLGLQFGSSAYSPRLAHELMRRKVLPHCFGIFTGTFVYALLAICAVDIGGRVGVAMPAVVVAFLWLGASLVAMAMLVPQIESLSITHVIDYLERQGQREIMRRHPPLDGDDAEVSADEPPARPLVQVLRHMGAPAHLQAPDVATLVALARAADAEVRVPYAVGDPVDTGEPLALVFGDGARLDEERVRRALPLGPFCTVEQQPAHALRLLVDIAIRALSSAVNDPATAVMALDGLEPLLRLCGRRQLDIGRVRDSGGALRLVYETPCWADFVALALSEILQYGASSVQVQRRLGALLARLVDSVPPSRRAAVQALAERRQRAIARAFATDDERAEAAEPDRQGLGCVERQQT